ncbi:MAG: type IV pilus twitching motility protein PilT [Kiritimatiellae bacterium]|nr:type IV pilus twitching motility protein PilT [Kiritimatiellia bacterium]
MAEIDALFKMLLDAEGSDLHLSAGRRPMIRESGEMQTLDLPIIEDADMEHFITEIMPERNLKEFSETNDTDFAYELPGQARLRANVFRDRIGMGAVFRIIPAEILSADQLNLPEGIRNFCYLSKGLVVVTGPTGSGKSTTLAAMIDLINATRPDHIITIEDPIEFVHKEKMCLINQREIKRHTSSFSTALRAALRQDPDVVMVGEMRDLETIEIAIETAETGHLVFGTLHTNTAISTVDRIIDAFPANRQNQIRTMLANSLKGVVAQTLCKRKPKGRVAALEVLLVDRAISSMIRDGKLHQVASAMQVGKNKGMVMLNESLTNLVINGTVDAAEAYLKAVDKDDMATRFEKANIKVPTNGDGTAT